MSFDISLTMHPIAAVLVCLACVGNGRRIQTRDLKVHTHESKVLATLFLAARSPEVGWHTTGHCGNLGAKCGGSSLSKRAKWALDTHKSVDTAVRVAWAGAAAHSKLSARPLPARAHVVAEESESDFDQNATDTQKALDQLMKEFEAAKAAEETSQKTLDKLVSEFQGDMAASSMDMESKVDNPANSTDMDLSQVLTNTTSGREGTKKEPDAVSVPYNKKPVLRLITAYNGMGWATSAAWTACVFSTVLNYPDPLIKSMCNPYHKLLMIAQGLAFPLPLAWAVLISLRSAAKAGWGRLQSATYRRLNLGLAASSLWAACAVYGLPLFTAGYDIGQPILKLLVSAVHCLTAVLCAGTWIRSVEPTSSGHYVPRLVRGLVSSAVSLAPKGASDDPDLPAGRDGRAEYALCTALFAWLCVLPLISSLPLATGQAVLALDRPSSAWNWLAATVCYVLKDAAERGRLPASTFVKLRHGLALGSAAHLLVIALKLSGVGSHSLVLPGKGPWRFYPNVLSMPFATGLSLATYALALFVAQTPPSPEDK
mmetsp:Transcript_26531/g.48551  ORF Transcript_26531/g.48551 Transcript_26531/m.48551 type:complete len:541 (-) Transcript_26531:140-1762(-)